MENVNDGERWERCLTFRQGKCPKKELTERAFLLQEQRSSELFEKILPPAPELEKALSHCSICEVFELAKTGDAFQ